MFSRFCLAGERHKWVADKIKEAFPDLENDKVQTFIRQEPNLQKFNAFFKGETSGRLFVLFQQPVSDTEVIIQALTLSLCPHKLRLIICRNYYIDCFSYIYFFTLNHRPI